MNSDLALTKGSVARPVRDSRPHWFAAYTTPRHEKRISEHFQLRQIEHFLPLYRSARRWKDGSRGTVELPLFPSYIFVHVVREQRVSVLQTAGVLSLVTSGREPVALPDVEIETLRAGLYLRQVEPHRYLVVGERVRISRGALAGMEGVLLRKRSLRVVLTLDLMMQSIAVEVDANDVEPVPAGVEFLRRI